MNEPEFQNTNQNMFVYGSGSQTFLVAPPFKPIKKSGPEIWLLVELCCYVEFLKQRNKQQYFLIVFHILPGNQ